VRKQINRPFRRKQLPTFNQAPAGIAASRNPLADGGDGRAALGHTKMSATEVYAERDATLAERIASEMG